MDNEDDGYDDQFDDDLDDDEDEPKKKKRVATSTKVVLVVAGWILLTLFLVGEFSDNKSKPDTASAELQTSTPEFDDGGTPDIVDTEAEAEFDLDGDGFLDETERGAAIEAFEASVVAGEVAIGESDISESGGSGSGGTSSGPEGETATPAVPGAAPSSGSGSSTTTTAKSGGGGSSTTTAAPTTTKPGNAPTTTASPTTTSPAPTTAPPAPTAGPPQTIEITKSGSNYIYTPRNFTVSPGTQVNMFNNSNAVHNWKVGNATPEVLAKGFKTEYRTINSTVEYRCTIHEELTGRITVE